MKIPMRNPQQVMVNKINIKYLLYVHHHLILDQESSAASEAEDHESEDDNDGRESFTVNY